MISIDSSIRWKDCYFRKIVSKSERRVLCFPDHLSKVHKTKGFCGDSITIFGNNLVKSITEYYVIGNFEIKNDEKKRIKIGDTYHINDLMYNSKDESPLYEGVYSVSQSLKQNKPIFIVNSTLKPWRYSLIFDNKNEDIIFKVYLFERQTGDDIKCIYSVESPKFNIKTYKYIAKSKLLSNPFSNERKIYPSNINESNDLNDLIENISPSINMKNQEFNLEKEMKYNMDNNLDVLTSNVSQIENQLPSDEDIYSGIPSTILAISDPLSPIKNENHIDFLQTNLQSLKSAYKVIFKEPSTNQPIEICQMVKYTTKRKHKYIRRMEFDNYGKNIYDPTNNSKYYRQIDSKGNINIYNPFITLTQPIYA